MKTRAQKYKLLAIMVALAALFFARDHIFKLFPEKNLSLGAPVHGETQKSTTVESPAPSLTPQTPQITNFDINDSAKPLSSYSIYHDYITKKKKLKFKPTIDLCNSVLNRINREYVDEVSPFKLFKGVKEEVALALSDAGISDEKLKSMALTKDIFQKILDAYSDKIDKEILLYASINGLIRGLDDRYCGFLTPGEYEEFIKRTHETEYCGVGISISKESMESPIKIIKIFPGNPAHQAGMKTDDYILKIDGVDFREKSVNEAAEKMRGRENTEVSITVKRDNRELDFKMKRKKIVVPAVESRMLEEGIGYIKIDGFKQELDEKFTEAYEELEDKGVKALIIDLRSNPGGLVSSARQLCGRLLDRRSIIAVFRHKDNGKRVIRSKGRRIVFVPLAILVDQNSASSSEITAGAVKDHDGGIIVGSRTRGKGSVQRTSTLKGGAGIKLTIEKIYTPDGFSINNYGINPDVKVDFPFARPVGDTSDKPLEKAVEILKKKIKSSK